MMMSRRRIWEGKSDGSSSFNILKIEALDVNFRRYSRISELGICVR